MIYKPEKIGPDSSYEYIKSILKSIGNITSFKAYRQKDHKYYEVKDNGCKKYYNLILFDDNKNEIWLDSNCGYSGTGPSYTEKILQIIGLRDDYRIYQNERIFYKDLSPNNEFNLIVISADHFKDEYCLKAFVSADFKSSDKRYEMIKALYILGNIHPLKTSSGNDIFKKYFNNPDIDDNKIGEYAINNVLFIDRRLKNISSEDIIKLLQSAFREIENVEIEIIDKKVNEYASEL